MTVEPMFPIQGEHGFKVEGLSGYVNRPSGEVPWSVAALAYEVYSRKYGKQQSLERLAQRGGFSWGELVWLLRGGDEKREDGLTFPPAFPKEGA